MPVKSKQPPYQPKIVNDLVATFEVVSAVHGRHTVAVPAALLPDLLKIRWQVNRDLRYPNSPPYVRANVNVRDGSNRRVVTQLHREVWRLLGRTPTPTIDHVDGNPLNNTADNLRDGRDGVNRCNNRWLRADNKTGAVGVSKARGGRWLAHVGWKGTKKCLGTFARFEDAVAARDAAVKELHGPAAVTNAEINRGPRP